MKSSKVRTAISLILSAFLILMSLGTGGCSVLQPSPSPSYALLTHSIPGEGGTIQVSPLPNPDGGYTVGTRVTLEARPGTGFSFQRWSGDAQGVIASIVVTVDRDKSVTAEFRVDSSLSTSVALPTPTPTPTVTVTRIPSPAPTPATVSPVLSEPRLVEAGVGTQVIGGALQGRTDTLQINQKAVIFLSVDHLSGGEKFDGSLEHWEDDGFKQLTTWHGLVPDGWTSWIWASDLWTSKVGKWRSLFYLNNNAIGSVYWGVVEANTPTPTPAPTPTKEYNLTTSVSPSGGGTVNPSGGRYKEGTVLTLTATPFSNSDFDYWSGDASGTNRTTTIIMNSDKNITANFSSVYHLTTSVNPSGTGSVSPGEDDYKEGTPVTLVATPLSRYAFDHWSGTDNDSANPTVVTMNTSRNVTAYFRAVSPPPSPTVQLLYSSDFSTNPTWVTNNPSKFYWDQAGQRYHYQLVGGSSDYVYVPVGYSGGAFRLSFDLAPTRTDFAASHVFGISNPNLNTGGTAGKPKIFVRYAQDVGGVHFWLVFFDDSGQAKNNTEGFFTNGVVYRNVITFQSGVLGILVTRLDTGQVVKRETLSGLGTFTGMDRLYMSVEGIGGGNTGAVAEGYIDNVELFVP